MPNPTAAAAGPTTRLKCAACGVEVRAVGWREGMAAKCKKCGGAMRPVSTSPGSDVTLRTIPPDPLIGQLLGGCRISRKIGSGGMGAVYEGKHLGLDKTVAIKILPPEFTSHATAIERFQREARAAAKLEHANIVQVLNVGQENGFNFIVMQYVEGESLGKLVSRRKALPWREALKYVRDAARGLASAHAAGVVHRDIKPDNILVAKDGVAKVADFGLARTLDSGVSLSTTGQIMGTPDYMSPEQAQATGADGRSDIYSLGATFFFLLTARKPFHADTPLSIIMKHVSEPLRPVRELNAEVPESVQNVVAKMMAKKADDRFADCTSLIAALDELERGGAPVSAGDLPAEPPRTAATQVVIQANFSSRSLVFAGVGIGAVLLLAAIVVAMVRSRREDGPPKPPATVKDPVVLPPDPVSQPTEKDVLALYKSLDDSVTSRNWTTARASLDALRKLTASTAYAPLEKNISALGEKVKAHDEHVASGMLTDLPGGAERWTFEFENKEEEEGIENHFWIKARQFAEKGIMAGVGVLTPRTSPDVLDGVLRARFQFIERARKFKVGRPRPGDDGVHPQAGFGFRVQEGTEAWGAGLEDLDGDKVKAMIGHVTQFKPKVEIQAIKALEVDLAGDGMFDLWVSFRGNHIVMGIGDKEVLAVDDSRLTKPGNVFFYSLGAGVKLDRVVFERSK